MTKVKDPQALAILEQRMVATFDVGYEEYIAGTALHIIPTAYFNTSKKIVETSGILEMVGQWDTERRKSRAGKKAFLPLPALVVLYLLNAQMGVGVTYRELARTVTHRLSSAQRSALGIRSSSVESVDLWYSRISETSYRLIALMNPRPTPLRQILGDEAYQRLLELMDTDSAKRLAERNQVRIDQFCNALVKASLRQLPKDIWNRYTGNVAIDATKVHIRGGLNSASPVGRRSNPDSLAGRYRREGNHDGLGAKTDAPAYEAETSVMLWNGPGENTLFPSLITVISCHNPGRLRGHAAAHMARHKALGFNHFTVVVDRAYNGEKIENFHLPAARLGLDVVFDYKQADLGTQSLFEDTILVDGSWYVGWMPQALIDVTKEFRVIDREITDAKRVLYDAEHTVTQGTSPAALDLGKSKERQAATHLKKIAETLPTLAERLKMREPYRMIPKGRRSVDGFQRFSYPPVEKMLAKPPTPPQTSTITIPPTLPHNEKAVEKRSKRSDRANLAPSAHGKQQPIKHTQRYPYKSAQWSGFYGMRSLVEASNSLLKTKDHGDIETPTKRSGRGYAAVYLAIAYAVVASNMKRIATFFAADAERSQRTKVKHRTRRRTDDLGRPLPHPTDDSPPGLPA